MQESKRSVNKVFATLLTLGIALSFQSAQAWIVFDGTSGFSPYICVSTSTDPYDKTFPANHPASGWNGYYECGACPAATIYVWDPQQSTSKKCDNVSKFASGPVCKATSQVLLHGAVVVVGGPKGCTVRVYTDQIPQKQKPTP